MSWHTVEIRPDKLKIMDGETEIGGLFKAENSWMIDLYRPRAVAAFKDYTSCLAFLEGIRTMTPTPLPVTVQGKDYSYEGWIVARFPKRKSGEIRYVVEDENGRLFIHNQDQLKAGE